MKIYKEIFVPYKIALGLKEKGFDMACIGSFTDKNTFNFSDGGLMYRVTPSDKKFCIAPLYQQVLDWLHSEHKLFVRPDYISGDTIYTLYDLSQGEKKRLMSRATKNEAIEEALKLI